MTRLVRASGERLQFWVASSQEDLQQFPEPVKDAIGVALSVAQFGGKHPASKPWKGEGPGVLGCRRLSRRHLSCRLYGQVR